jgi:hypothetical protein
VIAVYLLIHQSPLIIQEKMVHKTKGIILRTVKYGETSLVATIFTEQFGLQSYLVNGVRTATKKGTAKANLFQPSAILDLVSSNGVIYTSTFYLTSVKMPWRFL